MTEALKQTNMMRRDLRFLFVFMLMLPIVSLIGCGGDSPQNPDNPNQEEPTPDEPNLPEDETPLPGISFSSLTFSNAGDSFSCNIHGLTDGEWSAKSSQSWCNVVVHGNVLNISVSPNEEIETRHGAIDISHSDGSVIGSIHVIQREMANEDLEMETSSKNTFFPFFTATWCPFSPDMDRTLEEIQKRWKNPILAMRIHVKNSELNNSISDELSDIYDNNTTPTGYFENYFKVENMSDANVSVDYFWNLIMANTNYGAYLEDNYSAIGCKAKMTDSTIEAEVSVSPDAAGTFRLLVFIVEDNIIKPQMSVGEGEISNYCHNGVVVGAMTPVSGQEMKLSSLNKIFTFKSPLPSDANLSNLRLLVVLERNISSLNYSDKCWYADNCLSIPLGKALGGGSIENIYVGEDIEN